MKEMKKEFIRLNVKSWLLGEDLLMKKIKN